MGTVKTTEPEEEVRPNLSTLPELRTNAFGVPVVVAVAVVPAAVPNFSPLLVRREKGVRVMLLVREERGTPFACAFAAVLSLTSSSSTLCEI